MTDASKRVRCERHGESAATFTCQHLVRSVGAGFFTSKSVGDPRPDAWCARCEEISIAEGGWNPESERFAGITISCSGCYDELRARNQWHPAPPGSESFVCAGCGQRHEGLPYDVGFDVPNVPSEALAGATCTEDTCIIGEDRFVRGCLEIPIIGGPGPLTYGVWVTLSHKSFDEYVAHAGQTRCYLDGPYFGWFWSAITRWPNTMKLKTHVHPRPSGLRPLIELEPTDHPLAVAQREGISVELHREIALAVLHGGQ